jgi:EAL and modified HD-GYP domain-containing signal transduction protein
MLNVLAKLQNPECQVEDLEHIIGNDLGLSFKLLKIINSSFYNIGKTVESVHHALILLGLNALKKWVTLITLSSVKGKTSELLVLALLRARHCECLAEKLKLKPEAAFTVGMFSLLDAIMDQPLPLLLAQLPLSIEVKAALLEGRGELGELLKAVTDYEVGNWELIHNRFVHKDAIQLTYEQALEWSKKVKDDLAA